MKTVAVAIGSVGLAVVVVSAAIALQQGTRLAAPDASGLAILVGASAAALVVFLYWPVLAWLRRRGPLSPKQGALVTAGTLNAPAYIALLVLGRRPDLFAGGEVLYFAMGYAITGLLFGAGYAFVHRPERVRGDARLDERV